jgi:hypothetical protein
MGENLDADLETLDRVALMAEIKRLRAGIRAHRDSSGHDLCWHHPELWGLLPEQIDPAVAVPAWPQFCEAASPTGRHSTGSFGERKFTTPNTATPAHRFLPDRVRGRWPQSSQRREPPASHRTDPASFPRRRAVSRFPLLR